MGVTASMAVWFSRMATAWQQTSQKVKIGTPEVKGRNAPFWLALCACMFKHDMTDGVNVWHLWIVSQVDLSGDVVDGANPLRKKENPH